MSHDTWIHRLARVLVRPLANTPVTPNHLTIARAITGLLAAGTLASGSHEVAIVGACVFLVSMILDRADGELARLTARSSDNGHFLDLAADCICDGAALLALGLAARDGAFGPWAPWMGALAALSAGLIFAQVIAIDRAHGAATVSMPTFFGIDPDDFIIVIPLAIVFDFADPVLGAATLATPVVFVLVSWHLRTQHSARR